MRRTGLSIIVGAVVAVVCGHSGLGLAQVNEPAIEPASPEPASGPSQQVVGGRMSDSVELQRIVSLYSGGKYEDCARQVASLLDPKNPERLRNPQVMEDARMYHATCLVMSGRDKEAIAPLRAALTQNPTMGTPDSLTFPPPLISLFLQVRKEFADAIRAEEAKKLKELSRAAEQSKAMEQAERRRVQRLEELASTELVITRNRRSFASLPFGVGQFQNDSVALGTLFLVSEALLLGTSLAAVGIGTYQYTLITPAAVKSDIRDNATTARTVSIISFCGFLAVAAGGIAEAQINFVPEFRSTRKRKLPAELISPQAPESSGWLPWLQPERAGFSLGVSGAF